MPCSNLMRVRIYSNRAMQHRGSPRNKLNIDSIGLLLIVFVLNLYEVQEQ